MTHAEPSRMPQLPDWTQPALFASIGAAISAGFAYLRQCVKAKSQVDNNQIQREENAIQRENGLWLKVGELNAKIETMDKRLTALKDENTILKMQTMALKVEINDLLDDVGKSPRYVLASQVMRGETPEQS